MATSFWFARVRHERRHQEEVSIVAHVEHSSKGFERQREDRRAREHYDKTSKDKYSGRPDYRDS